MQVQFKLLWQTITSLGLSFRLVLFEKYRFVLLVLWWLFAFILAFVGRGIYLGVGLVVVGIAFFTQKSFYRYMERFRSALIHLGDRVEFADDQQEGYIQKFEHGKVLRKMQGEDVLKTGLMSEEIVGLYQHFYLIEMQDKNVVIPFEWVLSLDSEDSLNEV